jgi:hypothetical protein
VIVRLAHPKKKKLSQQQPASFCVLSKTSDSPESRLTSIKQAEKVVRQLMPPFVTPTSTCRTMHSNRVARGTWQKAQTRIGGSMVQYRPR